MLSALSHTDPILDRVRSRAYPRAVIGSDPDRLRLNPSRPIGHLLDPPPKDGRCCRRPRLDQVRDAGHAVQRANGCLGLPALVRILDRPGERNPAVVNLHRDGPLWGVDVPSNNDEGTASDLIVRRLSAWVADPNGRHDRTDASHAPDCLLGCHFLGVAAKMPGEDCDPILDRNPDASGTNVRLAIERVDDGAPEPLVVHPLSPVLGKTCRWRRA